MNITNKISDYPRLISDLKNIVNSAQFSLSTAVNQIRLETYWQMGKRLNKVKKDLSSTETSRFVKAVAKDLNFTPDLISRVAKFQNTYTLKQIKNKDFHLSWGHHVELLAIPDEKTRLIYLKKAKTQNLGRDRLRKAIKHKAFETQTVPSEKSKTLKRDLDPLYVYKAIVEKVVDGDTLVTRIDLGFHTWSEQRIRLRNINSKELDSENRKELKQAKAAKKFVEKKLKTLDFVVLKSFKTDKYGRFVADVFYHPTLTDKVEIAKDGFFLNQDLVDEGLAEVV